MATTAVRYNVATLFDKVQQSLGSAGTQPVGTTDQTGRARQLLAAKSGKAVSAGQLAPQSAVAEAAEVDQTRAGLEQVQPAAQVAAAQQQQGQQKIADTEAATRADLALRRQQALQQNDIRKQQLFGEVAREGRKLDYDRDAAKLEQMAHTLRLSDKKYTDMLELEGQRRRLDSELDFKEALNQSILGSNADLLKSNLGNKSVLAASDREFQQTMSQLDLNAALEMASNEAADARQAAMISGAGGLATAGISGYGAYADAHPSTRPTATAPANTGTTQSHGGPGSADVAGSGWRSGL